MLLPSDDMVKNRMFLVSRVARTASTQDVVRRAAASGAAEGFCCMAGEQTAGRGRQGRPWLAPPDTALLASVLLHVRNPAVAGVPFAAGLAMADALEATCGLRVGLKWPNDVIVAKRKLAGLLAERCSGAAPPGTSAVVVGAGVNLTVDRFPDGIEAISLHRLVESPPAAARLLDAWLASLDARIEALEHEGLAALLVGWRRHATGLGAPVRVATPAGEIHGVAEGVRDDGALLVRTPDRLVPVLAGDVHLLPGGEGAALMRLAD